MATTYKRGDRVRIKATDEVGVIGRVAAGFPGVLYYRVTTDVGTVVKGLLDTDIELVDQPTLGVGDMVRVRKGVAGQSGLGEVIAPVHEDHYDWAVSLACEDGSKRQMRFANYELELLQAAKPLGGGVKVSEETDPALCDTLPPPPPATLPAVQAAASAKPKGWRMHYENSSAQRKRQPVAEGFLDYMPAAVRLAAELSLVGNEKHNPGEPLHHARAKSSDHRNCAARHLMDADEIDEETNLVEAVAAFWRTGIYIQELCERKYGWPKAPRAKE